MYLQLSDLKLKSLDYSYFFSVFLDCSTMQLESIGVSEGVLFCVGQGLLRKHLDVVWTYIIFCLPKEPDSFHLLGFRNVNATALFIRIAIFMCCWAVVFSLL